MLTAARLLLGIVLIVAVFDLLFRRCSVDSELVPNIVSLLLLWLSSWTVKKLRVSFEVQVWFWPLSVYFILIEILGKKESSPLRTTMIQCYLFFVKKRICLIINYMRTVNLCWILLIHKLKNKINKTKSKNENRRFIN